MTSSLGTDANPVLNPRDRQLLLENLRPPEGYQLSTAVGTSYSLDLLALLVAPLAFTFFDWEDDDGEPTSEPLALLESLRRHAEKIILYCQAGEIGIPPHGQRLVAYLERCVVPVKAPTEGGVFHPKTWLLRFVRDGEPTRYRFLCLTRNLTFDRCWDSLLCLDGRVLERTNAISANHPLGDFIAALPDLALTPQAAGDRERVKQMAAEVRRVQFELPPGVDEVAFHPLGLTSGRRWKLPKRSGRLLVLSPFVSDSLLTSVTASRDDCVLISRPDELSKLAPATISRFAKVYVLDSAAEEDTDGTETVSNTFSGLHAKCFIEDDGWNAHVFTGSANATHAAFDRNVEFITELIGKKSQLGIEKFLDGADGDGAGFAKLLQPWTSTAASLTEEAQIREELEQELTDVRRILSVHALTLRCMPTDDRYALDVHGLADLPELGGVSVKYWPAMLRADDAIAVDSSSREARFGPMSLDCVTAFLAFELSTARDGIPAKCRFVLRLPLDGAPADRMERLLASQLADPQRLLQLLWLLLQPDASSGGELAALMLNGEGKWNSFGPGGYPIFEQLIRSAVESEGRVKEVGRLVEELRRSPEGKALLPVGLEDLWESLKTWMEARRVIRK
jgi:hypothetical protein